MKVRHELIPYIEEMLFEFMESKPIVDLVPSKNVERFERNGCMVRVATVQNPSWYKEMCLLYMEQRPNRKKEQTIIKRNYTIKIIEVMIKNKRTMSKYAHHILIEANRRYRQFDIPWNNQF